MAISASGQGGVLVHVNPGRSAGMVVATKATTAVMQGEEMPGWLRVCRGRAARRPPPLVAALADPERGWDAIVIGEYERAFYGSQYASMAPLFKHYGIQLWMPEVGGRVDWHAEDHEQTMLALGLSSKREITRTGIRVRTAMATQTREQGRYPGWSAAVRIPAGDAGPRPNKAHTAWGRRAHKLEPDPVTAPVARWMCAQRLAGHSAARITRALNEAGIPCPSAADPAGTLCCAITPCRV